MLLDCHRTVDNLTRRDRSGRVQPNGISTNLSRNVRRNLEHEFELLLRRGIGVQLDHTLELICEREGCPFQHQMPALNLRKVQNIVDDGEERLATLGKRLGEILLIR